MSNFIESLAYKELGVNELDVLKSIQITPQLREIATVLKDKDGRGTTGAYLIKSWPFYLRCSDDPDARKILDCYEELPGRFRRHLPIEAFCLASGVPAMKVLGMLTAVIVQLGANALTMVMAIQKAESVQKTINRAMDDTNPDAFRYMEMFHKEAGILPTPRGPSTTVNVQASSNANADVKAATVLALPPEATIRRLVDRFNEQRTLPVRAPAQIEATTEPIPAVELHATTVESHVPIESEYEEKD